MAKKQTKNKTTNTNNSAITFASVLLFLLGVRIWSWPTELFGWSVPRVLYGAVEWWSGLIIVVYAVWLWMLRKKPVNPSQIIQGTLVLIASLAVVIGLKLTSYTPDLYHVQNDGYNVSGGILLLVAGSSLGYLLGRSNKEN